MSVLSVAECRALVTTSLSDDDLQDIIDREESWLAHRVGPLTGERSQTFLTEDGDEVLRLTRHTDSVTVEDDDGAYSLASLRGWSDVLPASTDPWNGDTTVTYTPDDEHDVRRAIVTLVRLTLSESGYQAESAGGYSATSDPLARKDMRYTAWRSLLRPPVPASTRLVSAVPAGGLSISPVSTEATGS